MSKKLKILFLGDLVGRPGRFGVRKFLEENGKDYDFVIANVENASHGYGLTHKNYKELSEYGIHAMTAGNHIWDRKEIFQYIEEADKLVRPLNYPTGTPGIGARIYELPKQKGGSDLENSQKNENLSVGVINILGTVFMQPLTPPWELLQKEIDKLKAKTSVIIIDIHAEATAEKISCGHIGLRKGVSAVLGTHTHVQTADERVMSMPIQKGVSDLDNSQVIEGNMPPSFPDIESAKVGALENRNTNLQPTCHKTAYITDVGFCGSCDSVIGMNIDNSVDRLVKMLPVRLEIGEMDSVQINGVELVIDAITGAAEEIKRINKVLNLEKEVS